MNLLRKLFTRPTSVAGSQFDQYYTALLRSGEGYPTADEAKKDMRAREASLTPANWYR